MWYVLDFICKNSSLRLWSFVVRHAIVLTRAGWPYNFSRPVQAYIGGPYLPSVRIDSTRMWANAKRDGCPAEYRWRFLFNAAKFG